MLTVSSVVHKEWLEDKVSLDYYEFFADEDSDLPTGGEYTPDEPTDITYKIAQGSMGYVISTSTMYLLSSEGSWVEQESSGGGGGGGGTTNYEQLSHKPQINGTTLSGNKSLSDLGIAAAADIPSVPVQSVSKNGTAITPSAQGNVNITVPTQASDVNALSSDTKYAGSATQGGSATSAAKLDIASAGSATQPVYFKNGVPTATTYSLEKSVPSDAAFTDTTYEVKSESEGGSAESLVTTGDIYSWNRMIPASQKGANSGVATLDSSGKLVSTQLPLGSTASTAAAGNHTHTLSLASDSGTSQISLLPNTKYKLTGGGSTYVFTTPSDSDTTYTLAAGTGDDANKVVLTPSSGSAQKITVPYATSAGSASSASAVAWSGVSSKPSTISGYGITDAKIANGVVTLGANTITPLTSHQSVTDNNPTLAWNTKSKVATIGNTDINVTMPAQPSYTASDVGLGNVTNNAQVKKISSAVSGDIVTWSGTDGATVADSGVKVQASSTAMDGTSDAQVPTSKNIKTNVTKTAVLTDYTKSTTAKQDLATTDTVNSAFGKIEKRVSDNENNILLEQAKTTNIGNATNAAISPHKNRLNYTLSSLKKINTSGTWENNVYTLNNTTFTVNDDYTITVNSTLTSGNANFILFSARSIADLATCILSGCPAVSGASIRCEMAESPWSTICVDTGNSAVIPSTTKKAMLYIQISSSVSNIKFEPMICEPVYWSVSHEYAEPNKEVLKGKKILYNGDSICESRLTGFSANGGGYAKLIADETGCFYDNRAVSGGTLAVVEGKHNICTDVTNMPYDGDLICFEGGINDYQNNVPLGTFSETDYTSSITGLDTTTVCGALEAIIRQAIARWVGVPICFVIVHKIVGTAYTPNTAGYTFAEMREKMIAILNKYSIPYYDAYAEGGLNGYIWYLNEAYLNGGASTHPDGCHPDEGGYRRYYVPQLIDLFTRIMPKLK